MEWIKVIDQLPEFTGNVPQDDFSDVVLVHWPNGYIGLGQYWKNNGWYWIEQDFGEPADAEPTHWMPLPEAPQ